jgi:Uma2 family endonuclease
MAVATGITAEEFLARDWPRGTQLVRGEVVMNEPALPHQRAVLQLALALGAWCEAGADRGLVGLPVDVRIGDEFYAPDLWWVRERHRPAPGATALGRLPDLVVEVRSPSTWRFDIGPKLATYAAAGIAECWLVDTAARSVIVYRRSSPAVDRFDDSAELDAGQTLTSPLLPGFRMPVDGVFAG